MRNRKIWFQFDGCDAVYTGWFDNFTLTVDPAIYRGILDDWTAQGRDGVEALKTSKKDINGRYVIFYPAHRIVEVSADFADKFHRMLFHNEVVVASDKFLDWCDSTNYEVASAHNKQQCGVLDRYVAWIGDLPDSVEFRSDMKAYGVPGLKESK